MALDRQVVGGGGGDVAPGAEPFGQARLLHFTDCHAQLLPVHFREPSVNLGVGEAKNRPPHLVGEALLEHAGVAPGSRFT